MNEKKATPLWLAVAGALTAVGAVCWVLPYVMGYELLGIGTGISWGLYIATFFLLAGCGAGLLMYGGALMATGNYEKRVFVGATACLIAAGVIITFDLLQPWRILKMVVGMNLSSLLFIDFWALVVAFALSVTAMFKNAKPLGVCLLVAGVLLVLVEGSMLSTTMASSFWSSSSVALSFLVESAILAAAFVAIALGESRPGYLRYAFAAALCVAAFIQAADLLGSLYFGSGDDAVAAAALTAGSLSVPYWVQIVIGIAVPLVLLAFDKSGKLTSAAALCAAAGILLSKYNMLVAGQSVLFDGGILSYSPSVVEMGGSLGAVALAVLLYLVLSKVAAK